ncbi:MAG: Na/Pi cotransporter family protein [Deltaproteobacteria bacterium]|nr:Na/Pi cotransporter family protein [Deltaproteobacteria bacterium]
MSGSEIAFLIGQMLGGLALFLFGMRLMSDGLKQAAGSRLRGMLFRITRHRTAGFAAGTLFGAIVHSGPTTTMVVGFINAGLMTLASSIAVILGANVGTTLSMQLVSFRLDDWCFAAIALGLALELAAGRRPFVRHLGQVVLGFGLLFLGMRVMGEGVRPLRSSGELQAALSYASADSVGGVLLGVVVGTVVTTVLQSSGAMIGMLFILAGSGVLTDLAQAFALVLGAQIGTCTTTLFGMVGTNIEARRSAMAHLAFNVLGALLAVAMLRFYLWAVPALGGDMTHQIANAHTLVQVINAALVLPFAYPFARLVERLTPSKAKTPEHTHLDDRYIDTPEMAIAAAMRETRRMASLARRTLIAAMRGFVQMKSEPFAQVEKHEQAVNELKKTILEYLLRVASHQLSRRQALIVQQLQGSVADIERIGDHSTLLVELVTDKVHRKIWFDDESMAQLVDLYHRAEEILRLTELSLDPMLSVEDRRELATRILARRDEYATRSRALKDQHRQRVLEKCEDALTAMFYHRFVGCFDKIVRHSKTIAIHEMEPLFFVKPQKFGKHAEEIERASLPRDGFVPVDESIFHEETIPPPPDETAGKPPGGHQPP